MVVSFLERFGAPIYAEALSQLRGEPRLSHLLLKAEDQFVNSVFENQWCKSVLRLGGVPTLRFWRDLEETFLNIPVYNVCELEFTGLSRSSKTLLGYESLTQIQNDWSDDQRPQLFRADHARRKKIELLFQEFPNSEAALLFDLSKKLGQQNLYLGNSLPIREWDLVASTDLKLKKVTAARGANGIDGQLSAFLGASEPQAENWAIVGDLTALYDLQSLWITSQLASAKRRIVVVNNRGGMIFKKMFKNDIFLNSHQLDFSLWAKMFGWPFIACSDIKNLGNLPDQVLIELIPDAKQSDQFWQGMKGINI
jgi:2-succinyl-5-enolpyruvyl-6-hydroxy-3-cyclohexene-1-carboxylate synthase